MFVAALSILLAVGSIIGLMGCAALIIKIVKTPRQELYDELYKFSSKHKNFLKDNA